MKKNKLFTNTIIITSLTVFLMGCGHTKFDRGVSGAGIGAGAGAVVGAVTGLSVAQGALIGAGAGAITGLATSPGNVNLGRPAWGKDNSGSLYKPASQSSPRVAHVQSRLAAKGYNPGPVDGISGHRTESAIRSYQRTHGLRVTGYADQNLVSHLDNH